MSEEPRADDYYFANNRFQFWTKEEVAAENCFIGQGKIEKWKSGPEAEGLAQYLQSLLHDPEVARLFRKGRQKFYADLVERIRREYAERLAKCPRCGRALRTETAKQCFDCGYDWH